MCVYVCVCVYVMVSIWFCFTRVLWCDFCGDQLMITSPSGLYVGQIFISGL